MIPLLVGSRGKHTLVAPPSPPRFRLLRRPRPQSFLNPKEEISYKNLQNIMRGKPDVYFATDIEYVNRMYNYAASVYQKERRDNGEYKLSHPLAVAIRAARMGLEATGVLAALAHDLIEDTNSGRDPKQKRVTPEILLNILGSDALAMQYAREMLDIVLTLTKPHYRATGEWIFPTSSGDSEYYSRPDEFPREDSGALYDRRADVYSRRLFNSGKITAFIVKLLDYVHNAESYISDPAKRDKYVRAMRTMSRAGMRHIALFFGEEDQKYLKELFKVRSGSIDETTRLSTPQSAVIQFSLRDRFRMRELSNHPDAKYAFTILYGLNASVALALNYLEVGFVPGLDIDYEGLTGQYLPGFSITPGLSAVPASSPIHEKIFKISGIVDDEVRNRVMWTASGPYEFVILGADGNPCVRTTLDSLSSGETALLPSDALNEVGRKYDFIVTQLTIMFEKEIAPKLLELPINAPPGKPE